MSNLGIMYAEGVVVPQDYVEAHKWTNLIASRATVPDVAVSQQDAAETRDIGQVAEEFLAAHPQWLEHAKRLEKWKRVNP